MSYKVITIVAFGKQFKRLVKKFPSLKTKLIGLTNQLKLNLCLGTDLGNDCYKIRISIASKGKGKSGGGRIITYVQTKDEAIFLLSIYYKSEQENTSSKTIDSLRKSINEDK